MVRVFMLPLSNKVAFDKLILSCRFSKTDNITTAEENRTTAKKMNDNKSKFCGYNKKMKIEISNLGNSDSLVIFNQ